MSRAFLSYLISDVKYFIHLVILQTNVFNLHGFVIIMQAHMQPFDLILASGKVFTPEGFKELDVGILNGKVTRLSRELNSAESKATLNCKGQCVLPGFIDSQVHFREPGSEHKETLETGLKSAVLGGITAVFEMPNTNPLTLTPDHIDDKFRRAALNPWVHHAFYLGGCRANADQLQSFENHPGICGIKVFMGSSTGELLAASDEELDAVFSQGDRIIAVHAEDEFILQQNKKELLSLDNPTVDMHPQWRSVESCLNATKRAITMAKKYQRRLHVLHVTTQEEMRLLREEKKSGLITVEVLANHLTLNAPDCYDQHGSSAQQNPPIREKVHQDALWQAIADGTVDILASDHAPHSLEEKNLPYPQSPSGIPGVQTLLPIMLNHVNQGRLTLDRLIELMVTAPVKRFGIQNKGHIKKGFDADFTIVDMDKKTTIKLQDQASLAGWTPYDGMSIQGWPVATIISGEIVMKDGQLVGKPVGKKLTFKPNHS